MIVQSIGGKTLVSVGSWEEIYDRVTFRDDVDHTLTSIVEIIAMYAFKDPRPCGLKSCRSLHMKGYLVTLASGYDTVIGHICGRKHFGVDFHQSEKTFKRETNAQRHREVVRERQSQLRPLLDRISSQRAGDQGADSCYAKMRRHMTALFDDATINALADRARRGDGIVSRQVEVAEEDRELAGGRFREETIFIIAGIKAALDYQKIAPKKYDVLLDEIDEFSEIDADAADFTELAHRYRWAMRIDKRLDGLNDAIDNCRRFLDPMNIAAINNHKTGVRIR